MTSRITSLVGVGLAGALAGCASGTTETTKYVFNQPVIGGMSIPQVDQKSRNVLHLTRPLVNSAVGTMRFTGTITDTCLAGAVDVVVSETADAIVVTAVKQMTACYDSRITIKKDGTGGYVERRAFKSKSFEIAWPDHDWGLTKL